MLLKIIRRPCIAKQHGMVNADRRHGTTTNSCYFAGMDVVDLRNFYAQRLGTVARRFVSRGIRARWNDTSSLRVLGIGYATPYLGLFREEAERCLGFDAGAAGRGALAFLAPSARRTG